jgi:hypothetical protein
MAIGLGALIVSAKEEEEEQAPGVPGMPGIPPGVPGIPEPIMLASFCQGDAHLSPDQVAALNAILMSEVMPPNLIEDAATKLDRLGYPMAAACLREYAAGQRAENIPESPAPPGFDPFDPATWGLPIPDMPDIPGEIPPGGVMPEGPRPHTIRFGDIPYYMARYYTGDGARFRELEPINPHIGQLMAGQYPGWQVGTNILIPGQWNPWGTAYPPPIAGSAELPEVSPEQEAAYEELLTELQEWWESTPYV